MLAPLSHARYGWSALLLEIHFINEISQNPIQPFNPKQPESARVDNVMSSATAASCWPRGNEFSILRAPASLARTVYHFYLGSGTQNTAFVIFSVLFSVDRNTRLPGRKKRTYHNGVLEVSGGSMMLWTVALLLAIRLLRIESIHLTISNSLDHL